MHLLLRGMIPSAGLHRRALTWLTTGGEALTPIILDGFRLSPFVIYPISFTIFMTAAGLTVLLNPRRSVLDLG